MPCVTPLNDMISFIRAGGFPILIVLGLGLGLLFIAVAFTRRPRLSRLGVIRALTAAVVFASLSAVTVNFMMVMRKVPANPEWARSPDLPLIVMTGLGEAVTPAILGFTILSIAWMLGAVGMRQVQDD